jgi:phosphate transport system permease protein
MEASMNSSNAQNESVMSESSQTNMVGIAKRQRFQDVVFHRLTQTFSLLVLLALTGIIASLFINAWPACQ